MGSSAFTSDFVSRSTTGYARSTISPSLAEGGGNGSNLSTNNKAVIGGVVGGLGGAVAIGGLVFALWRVWGRKKQHAREQYTDVQSKRESAMTFNSEGYSNFGGRVNTASNF